jgi:molybdopterin synthase sulfur carrier subunit
MNLLYFAWLRTRIGIDREEIEPPETVRDVAGLLDWLKGRGERYAEALANPQVVRVAINQEYAKPNDAVRPGDEIALFPPVTGG